MSHSPFLESIRQVMRTKHYSIQTKDVWFYKSNQTFLREFWLEGNLCYSLLADDQLTV